MSYFTDLLQKKMDVEVNFKSCSNLIGYINFTNKRSQSSYSDFARRLIKQVNNCNKNIDNNIIVLQ